MKARRVASTECHSPSLNHTKKMRTLDAHQKDSVYSKHTYMEGNKEIDKSLHLQYLTTPDIFQYNRDNEDHIPVAESVFDDEVRKSAIDINKWEEDQKKKRELLETGDHPFLVNTLSSDVKIDAEPLQTIIQQIEQAKSEMILIQLLLKDINAQAGSNPLFRQTMRVIPSEERGNDLANTYKNRIANLESTYILFDYSFKQFSEGIHKLRDRIFYQRNYFNDMYNYTKHFNIVTFHSASLSFVRNEDCLLLHCGYTNSRDFSQFLRVFPGDDGYVLLKPHDACCYSYLTITTGIVDESRTYESSFNYHASEVAQSIYAPLINTLSQSSAYTRHNLHCINALRHSILCRDMYSSLAAGCSELLHSKKELGGWTIMIGDNELTFTIDHSFMIRVKLVTTQDVLHDEKLFAELIHEESSSHHNSSTSLNQNNCIPQMLNAFNHNVLLALMTQQYASYTNNPHYLPITVTKKVQTVDRTPYVLSVFSKFSLLYYKLFIQYFLFVLLQQFDFLVYTNDELTGSTIRMKRRIIDNRMEITVVFGNLTIANSILLTTEGVFVNGNHFTSLFDAFSGILVMFMQQIRLLYLNSCLRHHSGIARDLGNDLAVANGSGKVTVISFNYVMPAKVAFYHAFIVYCKQGNIINKDACWIGIRRKDREKQSPTQQLCVC